MMDLPIALEPKPPKATIGQTIAAVAERAGASIALAAPNRSPATYTDVLSQISQTIATLNSWGIGRNDRVAMVLPEGPELAMALISVAGAATGAPLNPAYKADEFDFYLNDLNAKALIVMAGATTTARDVAMARGIRVIELSPRSNSPAGMFSLERLPATSNARASEIADARPSLFGPAHATDIALVLHTSGTTSKPKLVLLTQANLCTSAVNVARTLRLAQNDCCMNVMPLFHIHGLIGAVLSSLSAGASVFCTTGFSGNVFFTSLRESQATWYTAVPTIHQAVLAAAKNLPKPATNLRFIRSSSAALPPSVMSELEALFNVPVVEAYGMTEAAHQMACNPLPPGARKPGSVGLPAGPEIAIVDDQGVPLATGAIGEIVIRGLNVTPGYENNAAANEKAFIAGGWFRTGDQGYLDADGYLFITGRLKEIINRGGEKISPREIDEILLDHPAVAQAVTFAMPHPTLGEEIAAAVVLRPGTITTENDIRQFAATKLAHFKVPRRVLFLQEIPKGPSGKVQRIGLAQRLGVTGETQAAALRADFVAPRTSIETTLAKHWCTVLNLDSIGIHDNFFLLGGDSLSAMRLLVRIRESLGVEVPISTFFESPTVVAVAEFVPKQWQLQTNPDGIASAIEEIQLMSDEEALRLLAAESEGA